MTAGSECGTASTLDTTGIRGFFTSIESRTAPSCKQTGENHGTSVAWNRSAYYVRVYSILGSTPTASAKRKSAGDKLRQTKKTRDRHRRKAIPRPSAQKVQKEVQTKHNGRAHHAVKNSFSSTKYTSPPTTWREKRTGASTRARSYPTPHASHFTPSMPKP